MEKVVENQQLAVHGLIYIALALVLFLLPRASLTILLVVLGVALLVASLYSFTVGFFSDLSRYEKIYYFMIGILDAGIGISVFVWPELTATVLLLLIALRAIVRGVLGLIFIFEARKEMEHEGWLYVTEVASIVFGSYLLIYHDYGLPYVAWLISLYLLLVGMIELLLSSNWKRNQETIQDGGTM